MSDCYLGDLLEGEVYETFDERLIYISKAHEHHCVVYECKRATDGPWEWNLRTNCYLRHNIRTIVDTRG